MDRQNRWIVRNFSKLVDRYGGRCVAVVNGRVVASGKSEKIVEKIARGKYPSANPSVLRVPRPKELICVLSFHIRFTRA